MNRLEMSGDARHCVRRGSPPPPHSVPQVSISVKKQRLRHTIGECVNDQDRSRGGSDLLLFAPCSLAATRSSPLL